MPSKIFNDEIEKYLPIVTGCANAMQSRCRGLTCERGDLISWGMVGLLNALREFDPGNRKKASLRTYISRRVGWSIQDGVNQWRRSSAEPGSGTGFIEDESIPEPAEEPGQEMELLRSRIAEAVENLPGDLRELIRLHYYEGYGISSIARERGVSHQYIAGKIADAVFLLRMVLLERSDKMRCGDVCAVMDMVSDTTAREPRCPGCGKPISRGEACIVLMLAGVQKKFHAVCLQELGKLLQEFADMCHGDRYGNERPYPPAG